MTINPKLNTGVISFFNLQGYCFRRDFVADDFEFPRTYTIYEPVFNERQATTGELCMDIVAKKRRSFRLDNINKYCGYRFAEYYEVVD